MENIGVVETTGGYCVVELKPDQASALARALDKFTSMCAVAGVQFEGHYALMDLANELEEAVKRM